MPHILIVGGGFAGLELAERLKNTAYEVTLIDKNNYNCFQPLLYQVATSGLEPGNIAFPLRKNFQGIKNIKIRCDEINRIDTTRQEIYSETETYSYDYLVLASGACSNFFGNEVLQKNAFGLKSLNDALDLRSILFENLEEALLTEDEAARQRLMNIVIVGGGPTGVEIAGALAEMRKHILPKDYAELDFSKMNIYLVESNDTLLNGMSSEASEKAVSFLKKLHVELILNDRLVSFENQLVTLRSSTQIAASTVIWAAGIKANYINGIENAKEERSARIKTNSYHEVKDYGNIYAIGDVAMIVDDEKFPYGHPQVAPIAKQHAQNLAANFINKIKNKSAAPYVFKDKGSMATIGRNQAVVDTPWFKTQGLIAWFMWMFVHLLYIMGSKNKIFIFINWVISYFTYDKGLRLIVRRNKKHYGN